MTPALTRATFVAALLALSACLGDFFDPLDQPGLRVVLLPADTAMYVGSEFRARARMFNRFGDLYPSDHITYAGADPIVEVRSSGEVRASGLGRARVIARRSDLADTGWVSVVPPGRLALVLRGEQQSELRANELDGSGFQSIASIGALAEGAPAWLPSGSGIVYQAGDLGSALLHVSDLQGGSTRLLAPDAQYTDERLPRPSQDGAWIYFRRATEFGPGEIWRVHPDGTGIEPVVTPQPYGGDTHPDPSPDGTQVVFVSGRVPGSPIELVLHDLVTGADRLLGDQGLLPRWSPQGDWIAYWKGEPSAGAIYAARPDGTEFRRITLEGRLYRPLALDWSGDGEWLLARGDSTMELVNVATGQPLPLLFTQPYHWAALRR